MLTVIEQSICKKQGQLYEYMARQGYDMPCFSKAYLSSDFCRNHFDTFYSFAHSEYAEVLADDIARELGETIVKTSNAEDEASHAQCIGYIYRKLFYETSISSAELAKIVPYKNILERFKADTEWFEEGYRGASGIYEDILADYALPLNKYSEGETYSDEELEKIRFNAEQERQVLEKLYCG